MTLEDARERLKPIQLKWLREIPALAASPLLSSDKGYAGKFLEELLGLTPGRRGLDFSNGELKTTNFKKDDKPKECVYVHQIRPVIDALVTGQKFEQSKLFCMTKNMLIVPVYRATPAPANWMFFHPLHLSLASPEQRDLKIALESDFYSLCARMKSMLDRGHNLSSKLAGKYLEIRNKDYKPYKPIYSSVYGRNVSDRDFAFWLQKNLLVELKHRQGHGVAWS